MGIVHREVIGKALAFGDPEDLRAGKVDHACSAGGFSRQQHMPGAEHIDGHDLLRAACRIVRERRQVHDRSAAFRCTLDLVQIQKIGAVSEIKAGDIVTEVLEMTSDGTADPAAMPGDQNPHATMISRRQLCARRQGRTAARESPRRCPQRK